MPPARANKMIKVQALVNLSLVRSVKGFDGTMQPHGKLVEKGSIEDLTEAEVTNFGRFVRVLDNEHKPFTKIAPKSPAKEFSLPFVGKNGGQLKNSGAMDMGENTQVLKAEEKSVWEDAS